MKIDKYLISEGNAKGYSNGDIAKIVEQASDAFWMTVEEMVTDSRTIEVESSVDSKLKKSMAVAVKSWIDYNV